MGARSRSSSSPFSPQPPGRRSSTGRPPSAEHVGPRPRPTVQPGPSSVIVPHSIRSPGAGPTVRRRHATGRRRPPTLGTPTLVVGGRWRRAHPVAGGGPQRRRLPRRTRPGCSRRCGPAAHVHGRGRARDRRRPRRVHRPRRGGAARPAQLDGPTRRSVCSASPTPTRPRCGSCSPARRPVDRFCAQAGLDTNGLFSCFDGRRAMLNLDRWQGGALGLLRRPRHLPAVPGQPRGRPRPRVRTRRLPRLRRAGTGHDATEQVDRRLRAERVALPARRALTVGRRQRTLRTPSRSASVAMHRSST